MYEAYWGLTLKPFQNTPDPRFIYYSRQHQDSRLKLEYAVKEGLGAAVLSGVFGCGKTTLLYALFKGLNPEKYQSAYIAHPIMDQLELLMSIVSALGDTNLPQKRSEVLRNVILERLKNILTNHAREGKKTLVIIDEAHLLTDPAIFEELRLLLNLHLEDKFLLTLVLSGQPDLRHKIENLPQLEQRVSVKCYLTNLNRDDTESYILHRLKIAGMNHSSQSLFTAGAIDRVYEYSGGIPRRINRLCDLCLLAGFTNNLNLIDEKIVEEQAQSLGAGEPRPVGIEDAPKSGVESSPPAPSLIPPVRENGQAGQSASGIPTGTAGIPQPQTTGPRSRPLGPLPRLNDEGSRDLYGALLLLMENFFNQVKLGEDLNIQPAIPLINRVIEKIISGDQTLLALAMKPACVSAGPAQNYLAVHSVNVAIIAIRIGLIQGRDKSSLFRLGLAGLLHDIGMIEPQIIPSPSLPLMVPSLLSGQFEVKTDSSGARYVSPPAPNSRAEKETTARQGRLKVLTIVLIILAVLFITYALDLFSFRTALGYLKKWFGEAINW